MVKRDNKVLTCSICGKTVERSKKKNNVGKLCSACRQRYKAFLVKKRCVEYLGGKCSRCGYIGPIEAFDFHHIDSSTKEFTIGECYNYGWERIKRELDKCELLCAICHRIVHSENDKSVKFLQEKLVNCDEITYITCPVCHKVFHPKNSRQHFCSPECSHISQRRVKNRPPIEQVINEIKEHGYCWTGRKYGVSDNAIKKWIKSTTR